jgi:hypothetical protein
MNSAERFFYNHAGWSYRPGAETPEQGRQACAVSLATAEAWASMHGLAFDWGPDHDEPGTWACIAVERTGTGCGHVRASLCSIDLGTDHPCRAAHARVVEAELAVQVMLEHCEPA